jgi:hypothetical protein
MADEIVWPLELIPDADHVFMRAHKGFIRNGELQPGVFRQHGNDGMSVDWNKYSTAIDTKNRGRNPENNAVVQLNAGAIRFQVGLDVTHAPLGANRAHAVVPLPAPDTPELVEARLKLLRISAIVLPLQEPS